MSIPFYCLSLSTSFIFILDSIRIFLNNCYIISILWLVWVFTEVCVRMLLPYLSSNVSILGLSNTIYSHVPFNPERYVLLAAWYQLSLQSPPLYYNWVILSNCLFYSFNQIDSFKNQVRPLSDPYFYGSEILTLIFLS